MSFEVIVPDSIKKKLKKLDKSVEEKIRKKMKQLETFPEQRGKHLKAPLHPLMQVRAGKYRIWYEVNNPEKRVYIEYVKPKEKAEEFY